MCCDAEPSVLVVGANHYERVAASRPRCLDPAGGGRGEVDDDLRRPGVLDYDSLLVVSGGSARAHTMMRGGLADLHSGTTGGPRGDADPPRIVSATSTR